MRICAVIVFLLLSLPLRNAGSSNEGGVACRFQTAARHSRELTPAVFLLTGYKGDLAQYDESAKILAAAGYASLRCGFTLSDLAERRTPVQDLEILIRLYDGLSNTKSIDRTRIGVYATSLGAYMVPLLAAKRPLAWIALHAPALYPSGALKTPVYDLIEGDYASLQKWRRSASTVNNNDVLALFSKFTGPTLQIRSGKDWAIPPATYAAWAATHPRAEVIQIPDGGHVLTDKQLVQTTQSLLEWITVHKHSIAQQSILGQ